MAQTVQNEFNQQYAAPGERKGGSGYIFYPGNFTRAYKTFNFPYPIEFSNVGGLGTISQSLLSTSQVSFGHVLDGHHTINNSNLMTNGINVTLNQGGGSASYAPTIDTPGAGNVVYNITEPYKITFTTSSLTAIVGNPNAGTPSIYSIGTIKTGSLQNEALGASGSIYITNRLQEWTLVFSGSGTSNTIGGYGTPNTGISGSLLEIPLISDKNGFITSSHLAESTSKIINDNLYPQVSSSTTGSCLFISQSAPFMDTIVSTTLGASSASAAIPKSAGFYFHFGSGQEQLLGKVALAMKNTATSRDTNKIDIFCVKKQSESGVDLRTISSSLHALNDIRLLASTNAGAPVFHLKTGSEAKEVSTITFAAGTINTASFYSASAGATGSVYLFENYDSDHDTPPEFQHTISFVGSVHDTADTDLSGSLTEIQLSSDLGGGNGLGADGVAFMSASVLAQSTSIAINNLRGFSSSFDSNVVTIFRDFVGDAVSISTTLGSLNLTTATTTEGRKDPYTIGRFLNYQGGASSPSGSVWHSNKTDGSYNTGDSSQHLEDDDGWPGNISALNGIDSTAKARYEGLVVMVHSSEHVTNVVLNKLQAFIIDNLQALQYDVEFDDALLELQGWAGPRFDGCKLHAQKINVFRNPPKGNYVTYTPKTGELALPGGYGYDQFNTKRWTGDVSYANKPVISDEVCAVYIGSSIVSGEEDTKLVEIESHAFVHIDKFLLINVVTDEIQIVDRVNMDPFSFKRYVQQDFPEGSEARFKILDRSISTNTKPIHKVKFNEGALMRLYTYTPNTDGFEDGVFGGYQVRGHNEQPGGNLSHEPEIQQKGYDIENLGSGSGGASGSIMIYPSQSNCGGLFSFGMTAAHSASLFTTNSISFIPQLPEELSAYQESINTEIMGERLNEITGSFVETFTPGSTQPGDTTTPYNPGFMAYQQLQQE